MTTEETIKALNLSPQDSIRIIIILHQLNKFLHEVVTPQIIVYNLANDIKETPDESIALIDKAIAIFLSAAK